MQVSEVERECVAAIVGATRKYRASDPHRLAQMVFDDLHKDPRVWATGFAPTKDQEQLIVDRIARAIEGYTMLWRVHKNTYLDGDE